MSHIDYYRSPILRTNLSIPHNPATDLSMSHIGYYGGPVVGTDLSMSYINNYGGPVPETGEYQLSWH